MTEFRLWSTAFVASLAAHVGFLFLPYEGRAWRSQPLPPDPSFVVDWVEVPALMHRGREPVLEELEPVRDVQAPGSTGALEEEKARGVGVVTKGIEDKPSAKPLPEVIPPEAVEPAGEKTTPPVSTPQEIPVPSVELLQDARTAADFTPYVIQMRSRIREVAERHRRFIVRERGQVRVDFVLDRAGKILSLDARSEQGSPRALLEKRASTILAESAPFSPFPEGIEAQSVSFSITLLFDD